MTTLENLYYGNICPHEINIEKGSEYDNLLKLVIRQDEELTATLTDKQKAIFKKYNENEMDLMNLGECQGFIRGFSLAVKLMAEAMS